MCGGDSALGDGGDGGGGDSDGVLALRGRAGGENGVVVVYEASPYAPEFSKLRCTVP